MVTHHRATERITCRTDHTVLPATRHRWTHPVNPSQAGRYTRFTHPRGTADWVGYLPRWATCPQTVTDPSI